MKTLIAAAVLSLVAVVSALAEQQVVYGPIAVLAISRESDQRIAKDFANQISSILREEEEVAINGEVQFVPLSGASSEELATIAGKYSVKQLVIAQVRSSDNDEERIFDVEVLRAEAKKVIENGSALLRKVRIAGATAATEIREAARDAAQAATTLISQFKEVWVILQFLSVPGEANYVFDSSSKKITDKQGVGDWEGTLPVGKTTLRVWKQGYTEQDIDVEIPSHGSSPYVLRLQVVTLKLGH